MQEQKFFELGENYRRIDSNEDENPRDFGGILEQAGLMSDSLLSVQGLSQGMLISCGNLEAGVSGLVSGMDVSNANLTSLVNSIVLTESYAAQLSQQIAPLTAMVNKICNGVVIIAKNSGRDSTFSQLGSFGGIISGFAGVASLFPGNPFALGMAIIGPLLLGLAGMNESRNAQSENEELLKSLDEPINYDPAVYQQQNTNANSGASGTAARNETTIANSAVNIQHAALENLSLSLSNMEFAITGTSSFVFQREANQGLPALGPRLLPSSGESAGAGLATLAETGQPYPPVPLSTKNPVAYMPTNAQAAQFYEVQSLSSSQSFTNGTSNVTNNGGANYIQTFAPVFHMHGLTIQQEADYEEVLTRLANLLRDAVANRPAGNYQTMSGGSVTRSRNHYPR
ncbi:MAG TPA: hypothetical protein IAB57_00875 [Candidatus Fimivivens faecavium]|nr:hypothetical protein [Candidatus Fimivivens faecavium]